MRPWAYLLLMARLWTSSQRPLTSNSAAAEAANNTKLFCVTAIKRNKFIFYSSKRLQKYGLYALTKMRKMVTQRSCNEAPEAQWCGEPLNDGLINGENGGMVRMRRWMISTCNRRKNKTGARVKKKEGRTEKGEIKVRYLRTWTGHDKDLTPIKLHKKTPTRRAGLEEKTAA